MKIYGAEYLKFTTTSFGSQVETLSAKLYNLLIMSLERKPDWPLISRRDFPKLTLGFAFAMKTLFDTSCNATTQTPEEALFPDNLLLDREYFNQNRIGRIIDVANHFPLRSWEDFTLMPGSRIYHNIPDFPSVLGINSIGFGHMEDETKDFAIQIHFSQKVSINSEFLGNNNKFPLLLCCFKLENPNEYSVVFLPSQIANQEDINDSSQSFDFVSSRKEEDLVGYRFVMILNRSVFKHQPPKAMIYPVTFEITPALKVPI